ncbi:MAG TPA: DUF4097 family beta strand repeat-containing protein [Puia sp.]|nr:DUF4097 family beta strand repeat-containing protein [Puia sp.]
MKNILATIILCALLQPLTAQKIIEKHFSSAQSKVVSMNIQIADSINVITWNKNEVYVKASIDVNDNKNNDAYKVNFDESNSSISIKSKFEFEKGKNCCGTDENCHCNCNCNSHITCVVYIPENTDFSVETIDGNISISGKTSQIRAHTISGFIDISLNPETKAGLRMKTISGTMYSDFDFQSDKGLRHRGGSAIETLLNGGGDKSIDLETISGDIFFRKQS